ncbi:hypothetical protein [Hasllibacter sp. MH4015]|uniref:hypothetical protein n=1 Tax=Hasllibacter sp. MH4015 TaxID=2854029 RepID=UPI001CD21AB3|nr:hypothetical protein [Hasllibacter sp. MH4015]
MFILSPETLLNPGVLETRSLPKKIFGRVQIIPRAGSVGLWARLIFEMQVVRYLAALLPFLIVLLFSRDMALPVTQAPLAMILVIGVVELKVLRLSDRARERLMSEAEAERILDAFAFRARAALREIAARHGIESGEIMVFAEQSELARVPPLTLLSVQSAEPDPRVLSLDPADRAALAAIFDADLTEQDFHRANLRAGEMMREVRIEARSVSAHARLAARITPRPAEA